jgi:hypothetical protein
MDNRSVVKSWFREQLALNDSALTESVACMCDAVAQEMAAELLEEVSLTSNKRARVSSPPIGSIRASARRPHRPPANDARFDLLLQAATGQAEGAAAAAARERKEFKAKVVVPVLQVWMNSQRHCWLDLTFPAFGRRVALPSLHSIEQRKCKQRRFRSILQLLECLTRMFQEAERLGNPLDSVLVTMAPTPVLPTMSMINKQVQIQSRQRPGVHVSAAYSWAG